RPKHTRRILGAPLRCKEKDARLPTPAEFASGPRRDMMMRLDELVQGLGKFLSDKSNIHKEIFCYQACLGMAVTALRDSLERQGPSGPPTADKETSTPPIFAGRANGKRAAVSPPALRAVTKRSNGVAAPTQPDTINNKDAGDQDEFVLVNLAQGHCIAESTTPPDAIVIKTNGSTSYADILKTLKRRGLAAANSRQQRTQHQTQCLWCPGAAVEEGSRKRIYSRCRDREGARPRGDCQRSPAHFLDRKSRTSTSASTRRRSPRHWAHYWASQSPKAAVKSLREGVRRGSPGKEATHRRGVTLTPGLRSGDAVKQDCALPRSWTRSLPSTQYCSTPVTLQLSPVHRAPRVVDLTFATDTLTSRVTSWAVSELYTNSDHQAIVFEIEIARTLRTPLRQSGKWNARSLDVEGFCEMMTSTVVPPGPTEEMATKLMAAITCACDASMTRTSGRCRRGPVYMVEG
ncbi:unnamed protein product, partial [Trichogramma brassicae]